MQETIFNLPIVPPLSYDSPYIATLTASDAVPRTGTSASSTIPPQSHTLIISRLHIAQRSYICRTSIISPSTSLAATQIIWTLPHYYKSPTPQTCRLSRFLRMPPRSLPINVTVIFLHSNPSFQTRTRSHHTHRHLLAQRVSSTQPYLNPLQAQSVRNNVKVIITYHARLH